MHPYAGEYLDKETGLYLMGARHYAPYMGRWITEDPYKGSIDDPLSLNLYVFVRNSPLIYVDPSGFAERRSDDEERYFIESANFLGLLWLKTKQVGYGVGKGIWKFVNLPGDICDSFANFTFDLFSPRAIANQTQAKYPYMTRWEAIQRGYPEYLLNKVGDALGAPPKTLWRWLDTLSSFEYGTEEKAEVITEISIIVLIEGLQGGLYEKTTHGSLVEYSNNSYLGPKWFTPGIIEGTRKTIKSLGSKSEGYIAKRGWTRDTMNEVVGKPYTTREAVNKATGNAATAYYNKAGDYVVVDNVTGELVQVSKFGDAGWIPDATIKNPYKP